MLKQGFIRYSKWYEVPSTGAARMTPILLNKSFPVTLNITFSTRNSQSIPFTASCPPHSASPAHPSYQLSLVLSLSLSLLFLLVLSPSPFPFSFSPSPFPLFFPLPYPHHPLFDAPHPFLSSSSSSFSSLSLFAFSFFFFAFAFSPCISAAVR
jgi:hypothetical protein